MRPACLTRLAYTKICCSVNHLVNVSPKQLEDSARASPSLNSLITPGSILFVVTALNAGGAERQVVDLARKLLGRKWKVSVASMIESPGLLASELQGLGVQITSLGMKRGIPDPRGLLRLFRLLRSNNYDVVHSHMVHANYLVRLAHRITPFPVSISTVHTVHSNCWRDLGYRLTDALADVTTAVSEAVGERYRSAGAVSPAKLRVLPNGIDTSKYRPHSEVRNRLRGRLQIGKQFVWLAAGRLERAKDYGNLLRSFHLVRNDPMDPLLLIAGEGPLQTELEELVRALGIGHRVRLLGFRTDLADLMNASDGYVMSSCWEGLPLVLLEAAASELPVIATDVGGNSEAVCDGVTGMLVPKSSPQALASSMRQLMTMGHDARAAIGAAGRVHVIAHYSLESVVAQWEHLYLRLMAEHRHALG